MANEVTIKVDADTKTAETKVKGMGGKMRSALKGVAIGAGALTAAAGAATMLGQEYQEATNLIAAGTGATGSDLEALEQSFKDVWAEVPQDAETVAGAIADVNTELGLMGQPLEDTTTAFLTASRAMGEDVNPMIKAVADAMIAFDVPATDTKKVLDELTVASQAVGVPITELADKVVKFGPQLNELGLPLTEATALIANMEAKGLDAGKMMPGLNTAIKKLADEGVTDITGGLNDAIESIQNAGTDAEAMGIAMDLFGAGAGIRFKDAIDKGALSTADLVAAMKDSDGTVEELGKETLTTSDKFDIFKNKVKSSLAPIGDFANAAGPLLMMIPAMTTVFSLLAGSQAVQTAATWLQTAAMTALNFAMGPIGLIIIGIGLAIAGIILVFKNWETIVETFKAVWDTVWGTIKSVFDTVVNTIKNVFDSKFGWLLPGGALLKAIFFLRDNWDTIWNGMKEVVGFVVNPIVSFINAIIGGLNMLIRGLNKVKVEVPSWVPVFGGKGFQFNIPEIPKIPTLAEGGIVRSPTLAMIGEKGPEAVIPLNGKQGGITINILGPTYGFDDFEEKVSEAITDSVRRGGFGGVLQTL